VRDRAVELRVNGQTVKPELWFPRTGAWTNWSLLDNNFVLEPVDLREGPNQIRLTSIGYNGPNVDALRVYRGALPPITLQEDSALLSGPTIRSDYAGYKGAGYVSFVHPSSDWLEWSFGTAEYRPYQLEFRYANGGDTPITLELWFNGLSSVGGDRWRPVFAPTGSWSTWSTVRVGGGTAAASTPALEAAGLVRVRLNAIGQGGPNIDSMTVRAV
jgi:hypothetical protein